MQKRIKMTWIKVSERLPRDNAGIFMVKLENGNMIKAYYYADKINWIASYGQKTSHWWNTTGDKERLDNVIEWREENEKS